MTINTILRLIPASFHERSKPAPSRERRRVCAASRSAQAENRTTFAYVGRYTSPMHHPVKPPAASPPSGATVPDLLLRVFSSPFLAIPLFLLLTGCIVAVSLGFIDVSWGDSGLKLTQGQRLAGTADVNIAGTWRGTGKDLSDSDHKLVAKYTYTLSLTFTQKGANVDLKGSYLINEDRNLPERRISGHGTIHGDYLSLLYDIEAGQPPIATTHGTMLFQVSPSSKTASGYYLTRSMANDGVVFGALDLLR